MEEKIYKRMSHSGVLNIVFGIASIVCGVACGIILIVSGARLLSAKTKILF